MAEPNLSKPSCLFGFQVVHVSTGKPLDVILLVLSHDVKASLTTPTPPFPQEKLSGSLPKQVVSSGFFHVPH